MSRLRLEVIAFIASVSACAHTDVTSPAGTLPTGTVACSPSGTVQLGVAQAVRVDCAQGGTTVTVAGNGASYLVVPQFAVDLVPNNLVAYRLSAGAAASASANPLTLSSISLPEGQRSPALAWPGAAQRAFDRTLRERALLRTKSGAWRSPTRDAGTRTSFASSAAPVPAVGTTRAFRVLASTTGSTFNSVGARLAFVGNDVLLYIDTLSPSGGFTPAQLQDFGALFDQTLYPIDTGAFGPPSDVDQNGHVIMLMTPTVNALSKAADCRTSGFVAGFFDEVDLGGAASDSNSNHGEIFYSIVPDPNGTASCAHTAADVGRTVPATFMHELQHLISFSQHVVVRHGLPEFGWLDEGLSIVAEELGSVHYEQKCPGTACRADPSQLFPDSSQGFVQGFLFDSYSYGLLPDTASVTLHSDSDGGFSWRGGDWLLMRWLGDQMGQGVYRRLDESSATGVANIESVSGQSFPTLFANFGLALVTDSLPGLLRTTAPAADRFVTRNMRQLWARLFATSSSTQIPRSFPIVIAPISTDTTSHRMDPGTNAYFRLDTPPGAATVSVQFAAPGGAALPAGLKPQLAIFRLPPGQ